MIGLPNVLSLMSKMHLKTCFAFMRNEKDSCYLRLWYFITKYIKAEITINPIIPMTGPYIASLLSIPVLDETVVEKGVAVSEKKKTKTNINLY